MTNLSELPEAKHERAERVGDPLAALHLADTLLTLARVNYVLDAVNDNFLVAPERAEPIFTRPRAE